LLNARPKMKNPPDHRRALGRRGRLELNLRNKPAPRRNNSSVHSPGWSSLHSFRRE